PKPSAQAGAKRRPGKRRTRRRWPHRRRVLPFPNQPRKGDFMNLQIAEPRLTRRTLLAGSAAAAACALPLAWAQQSPGWRLLVNEAVTADLSISMLAMRYR